MSTNITTNIHTISTTYMYAFHTTICPTHKYTVNITSNLSAFNSAIYATKYGSNFAAINITHEAAKWSTFIPTVISTDE